MALNEQQLAELQDILEALKPNLGNIYPSGKSFVEDQIKRFDRYGQDMFMSPKQWRWLRDINEEFGTKAGHVAAPMSDDEAEGKTTLRDDLDDEIPF